MIAAINVHAHMLQLLQTSNILRDQESRNLKQAGLTGRRITEIVTTANQRFHDALDEIEVEIVRSNVPKRNFIGGLRISRIL